MTQTGHNRAKELFLDALELAPDERRAFLLAVCGRDATLLERVEDLLAAHQRATDIEEIVDGVGAPEPEPPLALVGDYELFEELGRGAAGTVYRARQTSLGREVALKLLRAGSLAGENEVRRFRREAEAAAALDHPGIVPVFDIGAVDDHHFFSMKRVDGPSLDRVVERFAGDPRAAARLVASVARAVHHAHQRGVLHRDLKPSNILLDAEGLPHVADFGIAQPLGDARLTQTGQVCGTPAYMSPEQARGDRDVTVASDVWSLGCVLHELLSGKPPFAGRGVANVLRSVLEEEPPRAAGADRDLATVVGACLAKDPARRYPSARALAEDLDRWLEHLPVTARPTTRLERLRLSCRRSPVAASLSIAVALLLVVLGVGAVVTSLVLRHRLQETRSANERARERLRASLIANTRAERRSGQSGRREVGLDLLVQAAAIEPGPDLRDEAVTTLTLSDLVTTSTWELGPGAPAVFAVDGALEQILLGYPDGRAELRRARDGARSVEIPATTSRVLGALLTHGGQRLWLRRQGDSVTIQPRLEVWDLTAEPALRVHEREVVTSHFASSHDGQRLALARPEAGVVELIDTDSFEVLREWRLTPGQLFCAFRPDGGALAVATDQEHRVEVLTVPGGAPLASLQLEDIVRRVAWSPDGELLIAGCFDQRGHVWDTSSWDLRALLRGHEGALVDVALLPGRLAATHAWDGTTRVWDVEVGTELLRSDSSLIAFDREGRRALMRRDDSLELAELLVDDVLQVLHAHQGTSPTEVAESPDGRLLASCGSASWVLWEARSGARVSTHPAEDVRSILFDPLGGGVITSGEDGVLVWPLSQEEVGAPEVLIEGACLRADITPDGRQTGVVRGRTALLRDREGGLRELGTHLGLDRVAFSPDGAWLAIGSWHGNGVRVWDTANGEQVAHIVPDAESAMATFSPDATRLIVATYEDVRVLGTHGWELERAFPREGPRRPSVPAAFTPDGRLVALGIAHGRVRLVRVDGWRTLADLEPADVRSLFFLRFVDDGRRLVVATPSQRLLIWNLETLWNELAQRGLASSATGPWLKTR